MRGSVEEVAGRPAIGVSVEKIALMIIDDWKVSDNISSGEEWLLDTTLAKTSGWSQRWWKVNRY